MDAAVIDQHVVHFEVGLFTIFLLQRRKDKISFNCKEKAPDPVKRSLNLSWKTNWSQRFWAEVRRDR